MIAAGLVAAGLSVAGLVAAWLRARRVCRFGWLGWCGLVGLGGCGGLLLVADAPRPALLGPLAWTAYVAAADAAAHSLRGSSLIRSQPNGFAWLAVLSIFLWLPFEWYSQRLAGWYHAGLPSGLARYLLLGWSFACIWPALWETADLMLAFRPGREAARRPRRPKQVWSVSLAGAACLVVPLLVPRLDLGEHLLPLVAVGFLLLLEPWNRRLGRPGLAGSRAAATALAGAFCGLLADLLNYRATARWYCVAPLGLGLRVFELPLAAYPILPLFGMQAFSMYVFAAPALGLPMAAVPTPGARRAAE